MANQLSKTSHRARGMTMATSDESFINSPKINGSKINQIVGIASQNRLHALSMVTKVSNAILNLNSINYKKPAGISKLR